MSSDPHFTFFLLLRRAFIPYSSVFTFGNFFFIFHIHVQQVKNRGISVSGVLDSFPRHGIQTNLSTTFALRSTDQADQAERNFIEFFFENFDFDWNFAQSTAYYINFHNFYNHLITVKKCAQ